jgi:hypothetical protein
MTAETGNRAQARAVLQTVDAMPPGREDVYTTHHGETVLYAQ